MCGYKKISAFCRRKKIHGGSVIFADEKYPEVKPFELVSNLSLEMILECSAIKYNKFCLINIYRPPSGDFEEFIQSLSQILTRASTKCETLAVCGDFNIDQNSNNRNTKMLLDIFCSFNLTSLVHEPTRIFSTIHNTTYTTIDYVVTNKPNLISCTNLDPGFSDHYGQIITFKDNIFSKESIAKNETVYTRKINDQTIAEFKFLFKTFEFNFTNINIDEDFKLFFEHFQWCFLASVPEKIHNVKPRNKKIIFSEKLRNKRKELEKLNWLRKKVSDENLDNKYKTLKLQINKDIQTEKKQHYNKIISTSKNKNKTAWNLIKNTCGTSSERQHIPCIEYNNKLFTDKHEISNIFGEYLSTVIDNKLLNYFGKNISEKCTTANNICNSMFLFPVTAADVEQVIMSLPNKKSTGPDMIPINFVKICCTELCQILADLINLSIACGKFPDLLKYATIVPIYKKGNHQDIENYRPIALLSVFSKIFEKVIYNKTLEFLNSNNILSSCQHGFRRGCSTETGCADFVQHVYDKMDQNEIVIALLFDLTRAFDTVDKDFVSVKLHALGIRGQLNSWFTSFLSDRKFYVKADNVTSDEFNMNIGTPQGSVLGPLIFLLFINDLPSNISQGSVFMYADDTTIVISDPKPENIHIKVTTILKEFSLWCTKNKLMINHNKTICLPIHNKYRVDHNFSFNFNGSELSSSTSAKLLGVLIDKHFSWDLHIETVCNKLNKSFFLLLQLKNSLDKTVLLNFYYASVYSAIAYNIVLWGQSKDVSRVFILQKRILRLIFNIPQQSSCRECFKANKIFTITSIYLWKLLTFIYTKKNNLITNSDNHSYNTRGKDNITSLKHDHEFYKKSPLYAGSHFFNALPEDIRNSVSLITFKRRLKKLLITEPFYSLNEFEVFKKKKKKQGLLMV